ncbi:MAG: SIR2 family protein [Actinobacteria bacterium]|nr:SIR2 family protein [Actinomycetota bacterium]
MIRESDWTVLIDKIQRRQCTPFLGAGISEPHVPLGAEFSSRLAKQFGYPLTDVWNLPRVAQFITTTFGDAQFAKGQVADLILDCERRPPDFSDPTQPHRILADLRLPMYLTTNYDRFMTSALEMLVPEVSTLMCRWNYETRLTGEELVMAPTSERPLVYHLHGAATNLASMLLTEDDYVDFLMEAQADLAQVVPCPIQEALGTTSLLFVGYSLNDWNFRVLMRSVMRKINKSSKRMNMSVQLPPGDDSIAPDRRDEAEGFLCDYLGTEQVMVHWGDARQFLAELHQRWEAARPTERV